MAHLIDLLQLKVSDEPGWGYNKKRGAGAEIFYTRDRDYLDSESIMKKVLVVDDHSAIRMAVRMVLESNGYEVVGEASNGPDTLQLVRELDPDLIVLDIGIPGMDGLAVIDRLKMQGSRVKTLVLTSQPATIFSPRCMRAGAVGFVCKMGDMSEFSGALAALKAGYSYFPNLPFDSVASKLHEVIGVEALTNREVEVLRQLVSGMANKDIAEKMMLSSKTISSYKYRIMEKLGVSTFLELVEVAKRENII